MALVMTDRHVDAMMHGHKCLVRTFTDPGAQGPRLLLPSQHLTATWGGRVVDKQKNPEDLENPDIGRPFRICWFKTNRQIRMTCLTTWHDQGHAAE